MKSVLFVDYENVQNINLKELSDMDMEVKIFVGNSQNKIPFSLVQDAQAFGEKLEWIKIEGQGNNALDFHISYYLGVYTGKGDFDDYIILSKDKGFDPLVRYLGSQKVKCRRVNSIVELDAPKAVSEHFDQTKFTKVAENLKKIDKLRRPRTRNTLKKHIAAVFAQKIGEREIEDIVDYLFIKNIVTEQNKRLTYSL